jgi:anaerobic magnesium-protoporphyrin IX monomethyl ester cyclase
MKHAVLINNSYIENISVRYLGAHLKHHGFKVSIIHYEGSKDNVFNLLPKESLERLVDYCSQCDLVGISLLTTHQLERSIQINNYLQGRIKADIIWGGVPVMCSPRDYLQYTDYVCAGEGETVMTSLLEGKDPAAIAGLGYKAPDGQVHINPIPNLIDLNRQPVPYMELDNGFLLQGGELKRLRENLHLLRSSYLGLTIRGCPYACSYCINSRLKEVFHRKGPFIRFIETDLVMKELAWAVKNIPHLKSVTLDDDDFFLRSEQDMEAFLRSYQQKIDLPFYYLQATIKQVSGPKLNLLRENGIRLTYLKIGLQSASKRISKNIFDRSFDRDLFIAKLKLLATYNVSVILDVISENPYDKLVDKYEALIFYRDVIRNIRPLATIHRPVKIYDHKLMYYPGTKLYKKAMQDGMIPKDYINRVLLKRNTIRKHNEDFDNDTLVIALFNIAIRKSRLAPLAYGAIKILCLKPVFRLYTRLDIVRKGRRFSMVPGVDRLIRILQQEGLW